MRVVAEYMLREFWKWFLLLMGIFLFIYLLVDFLDRVDNYIEYRSTLVEVLTYYACRMPFIILQVSTISVLLAVIITLTLMNRNNEIVALKAAGVSVYRLSIPMILTGLLISLITFAVTEGVVPQANAKAYQLWHHDMRHNEAVQAYFGRFKGWYRSERAIYNVRRLRTMQQVVEGVSLFFFDNDYNLTRRVEAELGIFDKGRWRFENGVDKVIGPDGNFKVERFKSKEILLPESPKAFQYVDKSADQMSLVELDNYINQLDREGYDTLPYRVDRQVKFALPFVAAILALIATPISLRQSKDVSLPKAVIVGLGVAFSYLVTVGLCRSLGMAGTLPMLLAAWLPNLLYGLVGAYLLVSLRQ